MSVNYDVARHQYIVTVDAEHVHAGGAPEARLARALIAAEQKVAELEVHTLQPGDFVVLKFRDKLEYGVAVGQDESGIATVRVLE